MWLMVQFALFCSDVKFDYEKLTGCDIHMYVNWEDFSWKELVSVEGSNIFSVGNGSCKCWSDLEIFYSG